MTDRWRWDSSLYAGSAPYYVRGRVPYPAALVELLIDELDLDGTGRLLDLGCGPGSLTLPLAPYVEQVVAVDADEAMLSAGRALADAAGITHVVWRHARAEDLPSSLGGFRVATLAQSFHWMDRERVAGLLHGWLDPGGALVFVRATTHEGVAGTDRLPHPRPPREEVTALVEEFLGERRRAGRGYREADAVGGGEPGAMEAGIFDTAGFSGPRRFEVPGGSSPAAATRSSRACSPSPTRLRTCSATTSARSSSGSDPCWTR